MVLSLISKKQERIKYDVKIRKKAFVYNGARYWNCNGINSGIRSNPSFLFHMSTVYAHGNTPNCGYAASKADNEQYAYITVNQFTKTGSPTISMWVAPNGGYSEQTNPWSWTSTAGTLKFHYTNWQNAGSSHQLCAEQFGSGSAVIGGRWTP